MDLCIKYRPKTLDNIWGNLEVKNFISSLISSNTFPKCLIIYGQNGIGKSSLAYVISRILVCDNLQPNNTPCGLCKRCQLMDKMYETGDNVNGLDVYKYDIGLKTSSEYINQISNIIKKPINRANKNINKIIHIDELQLLGFNEQEKLNNPIEFCDSNTHILITTTNINAIAKSIKSRSTVITLSTPLASEQALHLPAIAFKEGHPSLLTSKEYEVLAEVSGSPRRTLKNLQDIISSGKDTYYSIVNQLESSSQTYVQYFEAIEQGILTLIEFIESLPEPIKFISSLGNFIYKCICSRYGKRFMNNKSVKSVLTYSDKNLIEVIKILSKNKLFEDDNARELLLVIGFDLNNSLINSLNNSDANNSMNIAEPIKLSESEQAEEVLHNVLNSTFGQISSGIQKGEL